MKKKDTKLSGNKSSMFGGKKNLIWIVFFLLIAFLSIISIMAMNKSFSFSKFVSFLSEAKGIYILCAVLSVLLYIVFEGISIQYLCRKLNSKTRKGAGFFYAAADLYFSAITPSATGGQPASAYFMVKDGISLPVATTALLYTLLSYSLSMIVISCFTFLIRPSIFFSFDVLAKMFVIVGLICQVVLVVFYFGLLYNEKIIAKLCRGVLNFLDKLHMVKNKEEKLEKLTEMISKYRDITLLLKDKKAVLVKAFLINLGQRIFQIMVIVFVFMATGGKMGDAFLIFSIESFVLIGAYCVPIPGAIGLTDYLMLNGFKKIMNKEVAVNLELLSRGLSFYCCIVICGIAVLIRYLVIKRRTILKDSN